MFASFQFAFVVTAPIFIIICLGIFLRRMGWVSADYAKMSSDLVFRVALPSLLFLKVARSDFSHPPYLFVLYSVLSLLVCFYLVDRFVAPRLAKDDRGVLVQGALRSNLGIIGLAYCLNAFGDEGMTTVAAYVAAIIVLINALCVISLNRHHGDSEAEITVAWMAKAVAKNPLIRAISLAVVVSWFNVPLPTIAWDSLTYIAQMTLPLSLICVGASIRWHEFRASKSLYLATLAKLVVFPALVTGGGILLGFRGVELGVLYLMSASPSATVSYAMVRAIGGNYHLAAAIVAATSLGSIVTTTIGLFFLKQFGFV